MPLATGRNELTFSAEGPGSDWLRLRGVYFVLDMENENALLQSVGRSSRDHTFFYLSNVTYGRLYQQILEGKPVSFQSARLQLEDLAVGEYRIDVFDTAQGHIIKTQTALSGQGILPIALDAITGDAAFRVSPQAPGSAVGRQKRVETEEQ